MSVKTLATQDELKLQFDLLEKSETGTFQVATNNLKDHLEATRSLFAMAHNTQGMQNHIRWVLGDVINSSGAMFNYEYDQELDGFAELINWSSSSITEVVRTSKTYWTAEMRRLSYDPHTWETVYGKPGPSEAGGEHSPLNWNVFDAVSRNLVGVDDRALDLLSYILWCQGYSQAKAKGLLKLIELEDDEYTDEIAKIAKMAPVAQRDYIAELKKKHTDTEIRGKYIVLTIVDEPQPNGEVKHVIKASRQVEVDDYIANKSDMIIHKTSREFYMVTGFDGKKPISTIMPTDAAFG